MQENVYGLLSKVYEARNQCIQQGKSNPSKEELASCAGMSVEKLDALLRTTRTPLSLQQPVWSDQATTFLEITADMEVEAPDVAATKHLMRRHTRNLLSFLNPRERKILRLRFGLEDGKQRSLSDIGNGLGLTKERIRQLENRAMYKLKQCLNTQGLAAYTDLLI
ncbi:hypothetical protein M569_08519 [Genlisea aurea]|uniref:RNA polymerase sigma-70 domain-containing protein n=1 Tax=Genlisea aurea TaxID=192259 RepID=S8CGZ1_9LAMI|nr:hypothetical protein M569_08519 [Genlisea aurea]